MVGTYIVLILLLNIPAVKSLIGSKASEMLSEKLGTEVTVGKVDLWMLNRLIIDDIKIMDQDHKTMLSAPRLSVKLDILDLFNGEISISSAQIFGMKANLYRKTAHSDTNFQFFIDSLSSKDKKEKSTLNLKISSLVIRRSEIAYNQLDVPNNGLFSTKHINLRNISAHVILNRLTNDSINVNIKRISLQDLNGIAVRRLSLRFDAGPHGAHLFDFRLQLPHSNILINDAVATYSTEKGKINKETLRYNAAIEKSTITPSDLRIFSPLLNNYSTPLTLSAILDGTAQSHTISNFILSQDRDIDISLDASVVRRGDSWQWKTNVDHITTSASGLRSIAANLGKQNLVPIIVDNLGDISVRAKGAGFGDDIRGEGLITTDIGAIEFSADNDSGHLTSDISTHGFDIAALTDNASFGIFRGGLSLDGTLDGTRVLSMNAKTNIDEFTYNSHSYRNATASVHYVPNGESRLQASLDDDAGVITIDGIFDRSSRVPNYIVDMKVKDLSPSRLGITDRWDGSTFDFILTGNACGSNVNDIVGDIAVDNFVMHTSSDAYRLNSLDIHKAKDAHGTQRLSVVSDFCNVNVDGRFDYRTLFNSIIAAVSNRLPTMPGLPKAKKVSNSINIYATVSKTDWAEHLLGIPLTLHDDAHLVANIDDASNSVNINFDAPGFTYDGKEYREGYLIVTSPNDTLRAKANVVAVGKGDDYSHYTLNAKAIDNRLASSLGFRIHGRYDIKGAVNSNAHFYDNSRGEATAQVNFLHSDVHIGDTVWTVAPSTVVYSKQHLSVDKFSIYHDDQNIQINGMATRSNDDDIKVTLKDVNVAYILDLVNFHSVEFSGYATGEAHLSSLFGSPSARADLKVADFHFENGSLGLLAVKADWDNESGAINIDGFATEKDNHSTVIGGYVSPQHKKIDLHISANGSSLDFLNTYCDSFASDINLRGWGNINVVGPFSSIQIIGDARVSGSASITSLNTSYTIEDARVKFNPDDIIFYNDTIRDRNGNIGIVNGHLRHQHLGRFSYDINIDAHNLLAYDTHTFGSDVFYGTAYATGTCSIKGRSGEVVIDIDAVPNRNSVIVYNAASPDAIANSEFIHWNDRSATHAAQPAEGDDVSQHDVGTNMYINMLIHCNPDATIRILMDQQSGDYISLNGNGAIRTSYYNKGTFDMFGNYSVERGVYKLTIQNVIKRDFDFLPGGTIAFGGDAYNALLNLQAQYTLNSVPLSDINLGRSFSNNNIRVDCIMNISGTPAQPHVEFSLDMPTVSTDAKQMVMSVMNSNEEINQQVLYLLAVGRFLNQDNNSSTSQSQRQSQTSLAMQSILSGTISQQLSSVLENVVGSNQWNLGANISTGDEGFNNAEYEGLVSGHLLNNRLLINGQFGYRDNPNATSSFIGDFDIRYLLVPSGSAAIRVYNQTNDKYFTKNSLNTQGVGLIFKKDFNGWRDFFRWGRRRKK